MKKLLAVAGVVGMVGGFAACGSDEHPEIADPGGSRGGNLTTGGRPPSSSTEGGEPNGGVMARSDGLAVTITAPAEAEDPVADDVLVDGEVTVVCTVREGDAGKPDPSTVKLEVLDAEGEPILGTDEKPLAAPGTPTGETDEYSATFNLDRVDTGAVSFRCSAVGLDESESGSDEVHTFVDHGPVITDKLPIPDKPYALNKVLAVEFTIAPALLSDDDEEAALDSLVLRVAGVEIEPDEDEDSPGTYRASVNFLDGALFEEPPTEHTSVRIEATNSRTPAAAVAIREYPIIVDGVGPKIAFTKPKANAPINGETVVEFTVSDSGAGLDPDTLELTVTGLAQPQKFDLDDKSRWTRKGDTFTFRFDTGNLVGVESQIAVNVRARDQAGNLTDGVTLLMYLDDQPPWIDLDPGFARGKDGQDTCSAAFDPLGSALSDGEITAVRNNMLRALIYDQTNHGSGQTVFYMAGTDPAAARLYIQPDPSQPFLVDTNDDGVCDDLAREDFIYQSLAGVSRAGALTYSTADQAIPPVLNDQGGVACLVKNSPPPKETLCLNQSDMRVVIQHDVDTKADEPVVYAMGALTGFECTGSRWDLGNVPGADGWVCLAARAYDRLGNRGISRPLRLCFDNPDVPGQPACATGAPAPSCTTDCTAPAPFPPHIFRF